MCQISKCCSNLNSAPLNMKVGLAVLAIGLAAIVAGGACLRLAGYNQFDPSKIKALNISGGSTLLGGFLLALGGALFFIFGPRRCPVKDDFRWKTQ